MSSFEMLDDNELIERAKHGDQSAIWVLLERHDSIVKNRIFYHLHGIRGISQEIIRDRIRYHVMEQFHRYKADKSAFTTWLYYVARNWLIDYWRKQRGSPQEPNSVRYGDELITAQHNLPIAEQSFEADDHSQLLWKLTSQALLNADFSPEERRAAALFFSENNEALLKGSPLQEQYFQAFKQAAAKLAVTVLKSALLRHGKLGACALLSDYCEHPIHFSSRANPLPGHFVDNISWNLETFKAFSRMQSSLHQRDTMRLERAFLQLIELACSDMASRTSDCQQTSRATELINRDFQYIFLACRFCGSKAADPLEEGFRMLRKVCPEMMDLPIVQRNFARLYDCCDRPDLLTKYLLSATGNLHYDIVDMVVMCLFTNTIPKKLPELLSTGDDEAIARYMGRTRASLAPIIDYTTYYLSIMQSPVMQSYLLRLIEIQLKYLRLTPELLQYTEEGLLINYSCIIEREQKRKVKSLLDAIRRRKAAVSSNV